MAVVFPFPLIRRPGYVEKIARHLRSMPTQSERNQYMLKVIGLEFEREMDAGIRMEVAEADLMAFADAVWLAVRGVQRGGAA